MNTRYTHLRNFFFILFLLGLGTETFAQRTADTVIVRFGKQSHLDIHIKNPKDIEALQVLDMNKLIADIAAYLQTVKMTPLEEEVKDSVAIIKTDTANVKVFFNAIRVRTTRNGDNRSLSVQIGDETNESSDTDEEDEDDGEFDLDIDFGLNRFVENGSFSNNEVYDLRLWGSRYVALHFEQYWRLGRKNARTPVFIRSGLSLAWYNFMFEENVQIVREGEQVVFTPLPQELDKSKLTVSYLSIPLTLQLGSRSKNLFSVAVGAYAGIRLGSKSKIVFDEAGDRVKSKEHSNFHLRNFRYGARVEVNVGRTGFAFFGNYDFNTLFRANRGPEVQAISFGVVI